MWAKNKNKKKFLYVIHSNYDKLPTYVLISIDKIVSTLGIYIFIKHLWEILLFLEQHARRNFMILTGLKGVENGNFRPMYSALVFGIFVG